MCNSLSPATFIGVELRADLSWLVAFGLVVWMLNAYYFPAGSAWTFATSLILAADTAVEWRYGGSNEGLEPANASRAARISTSAF